MMENRMLTSCSCLLLLLAIGYPCVTYASTVDAGVVSETPTTTLPESTTCIDRGDRDCPSDVVRPSSSSTSSTAKSTTISGGGGGADTTPGGVDETSSAAGPAETTTASPARTTAGPPPAPTGAQTTTQDTEATTTSTAGAIPETTTSSASIPETTTTERSVDTTEKKDLAGSTTTSDSSTEAATTTQGSPSPTRGRGDTPGDDPCTDFIFEEGIHFSTPESDNCSHTVNVTTDVWIQFTVGNDTGRRAEIPYTDIKSGYCGSTYPYRLFWRGITLPIAGETTEAQICTHVEGPIEDYCTNRQPIQIHNCYNTFFVYKFTRHLDASLECTGICLKYDNESVGNEFLANPPTTVGPPETTTEAPETFTLPRKTDQENGTVTIEYKFPEDEDESNVTAYWAVNKDEQFRTFIAKLCNRCIPKKVATQPPTTTIVFTTLSETATESTAATDAASTQGTTTRMTTRRTTTEAEQEFEKIVIDDPSDTQPQATKPDLGGVDLDDNTDQDSGKGPSRRSAGSEPSDCEQRFSKDDVFYVYDTPKVSSGILQISFIVVKPSGNSSETNSTVTRRKRDVSDDADVVSQEDLFNALNGIDAETHKDEMDLEYVQHYKGEPQAVVPPDAEPGDSAGATDPDSTSLWDAHMGLFIAIIILIILCLIVVIIGILCIKCKGRKSSPEKTPLRSEEGMSPMVMENPITDEEMKRGEAPMLETHNPAYTANGSGHHLSKGDEENGWIVPLEELTYEERGRPEVDNTRL